MGDHFRVRFGAVRSPLWGDSRRFAEEIALLGEVFAVVEEGSLGGVERTSVASIREYYRTCESIYQVGHGLGQGGCRPTASCARMDQRAGCSACRGDLRSPAVPVATDSRPRNRSAQCSKTLGVKVGRCLEIGARETDSISAVAWECGNQASSPKPFHTKR